MQNPGCKACIPQFSSKIIITSSCIGANKRSNCRSRHQSSCRASSSEVSLFTDSSLSGPGLGLSGPGTSSKKPALKIEDVSLESEVKY